VATGYCSVAAANQTAGGDDLITLPPGFRTIQSQINKMKGLQDISDGSPVHQPIKQGASQPGREDI
jgi:hypothetical protein